jgi:hypothetical protein
MGALPAQLRGSAELLLTSTSDDGWMFPGQKAGRPTHTSEATDPETSLSTGLSSEHLTRV